MMKYVVVRRDFREKHRLVKNAYIFSYNTILNEARLSVGTTAFFYGLE
jgi:hypothetical protein